MTSCERTHLPWKNLHSHNLLMKTHQNSKYEPVNPNGVRLISKKLSKTNYWLYYTVHIGSTWRHVKEHTHPEKNLHSHNLLMKTHQNPKYEPVNPNGVRLMSKKLSKTNYWLYYTVHIGSTWRHVKEHTHLKKIYIPTIYSWKHIRIPNMNLWTQTVCV